MSQYLNQAEHNEGFYAVICSYNASSYYDWKITCQFYVAIHYLKALAEKKGINIGQSHGEIERNVSPQKNATVMPLPMNGWTNYKTLYRYSRAARYNGFTDAATFAKLMEKDHNHSSQCLTFFKAYIKSQGVAVK